MIKRILVGIGGTPFTSIAIQRAIELAQIHEAEVTGITVVDIDKLERIGPVGIGGDVYAQRIRDQRIKITRQRIEEVIGEFESACADAGITHRVKRETGAPFDLLIARARYNDLIVFGLRGLFDYGVVNEPKDTLSRLIEEGVRPVIAAAPQYRTIRKALIAYSGSMESAKAMQRFIQFQSWPDVKVKVVCFDKDEDEAKELLAGAEEYCRSHGFDAETESIQGSVRGQLLQHADDWNADVIVMGNSARGFWRRRVLGDTLLHVIQHTERTLFLGQ